MRGILFFLALIGVLFSACYMDAGYDPSDKYDDKAVDYVVPYGVHTFCGSDTDKNCVPKCNENTEGMVFYVLDAEAVYACIDHYWTEKRKISEDDPELYGVPMYDGHIGRNSSSSRNYSSSSSVKRSSSSSNCSWCDDDYDDDDDYYYGSSSSSISYTYFVDPRDSKRYALVTIGDRVWMAENLRYNDEKNPYIYAGGMPWSGSDSVAHYYNQPYSTLCPDGFHIPNEREWNNLFEAVGGSDIAGTRLQSVNFYSGHFTEDDRNMYGFSAEPLDFVFSREADFSDIQSPSGFYAAFWTYEGKAVLLDGYKSFARVSDTLSYKLEDGTKVSEPVSSSYFLSVRCVEDAL